MSLFLSPPHLLYDADSCTGQCSAPALLYIQQILKRKLTCLGLLPWSFFPVCGESAGAQAAAASCLDRADNGRESLSHPYNPGLTGSLTTVPSGCLEESPQAALAPALKGTC